MKERTGRTIDNSITKIIRNLIIVEAEGSKEYLERYLTMVCSIEYCKEKEIPPEKTWLYYHTFNYEFNICFHKPKQDLG